MTFEPDRVETVTVDSYGTLVDPNAAEKALADRVPDPEPVSKLWRSRSLMYTMVGNDIEFYQPFYEMNRDALQYALDVHDVDLPPEERDEILAVYHELDVFEDVEDGVGRLRDSGYDVYVVSNGNPEMLESMVNHAGLDDLVTDTISAQEIETFKPDVEIYRHAAARTGTPIQNIVHVAGPAFDVLGAKHAGMQGAWINRGDGPWELFAGVDPDITIETFHDLAEALGV
jgi:2-haloacid dehalogenase